mgnify:CR=1 FL=1
MAGNENKFVAKNGLRTQNVEYLSPDRNSTINLEMLDSDTLSWEGDSGQLFSITDSLSGTIFSVNDISGIPSIEVDDDGTVRLAEFSGNVLIGTNTDNGTDRLQVDGSVSANSFSGNGSSLTNVDAETLDNLNSSQFLRSDTSDTMNGRLEMGNVLDMNNNDIYGVDQIFHQGDTNTYMQFHSSDQWRVVTGGAERLEVNNSQVTVQNANFNVDDGDVRSRGAGFRNATGNYGTIRVDDDRSVSWAGYAIRDDWVFMSDGSSRSGIYNDTDNDWAIRFNRNAEVELYHNGSQKLQTTSGGVSVSGNVSASSFSGDGSSLTNLPAAPVPTSDNPPSSPSDGQLWWDSSDGNLYIYFQDSNSSQWVTATSLPSTVPAQAIPNGGTATQFLMKATSADYDTTWSSDLTANSASVSGDLAVDSITAQNNSILLTGDLNVTGVITSNFGSYRPGEIIECLSSPCNGSTVTGVSGTYTWPLVTGSQVTTDSYQILSGSNLSYTPPAGTSRVIYEFTFHESAYAGGDARSIIHYRFYAGNDEIIYARHTREEDQAEDMQHVFTWTIGIGGGQDLNSGILSSWDSPRELKLEMRRYNSSYDTNFHVLNWFDGSGSNGVFHMPRLTITAIA